MRLYIVRHAIALPHGTPGVPDDGRILTEDGVRKMRQAAAGLRRLDYVPDLILTSPLIRARQTADILSVAFGGGVEVKTTPALAPSGSRQDLYRQILKYSDNCNSIMLVGHQPSLGEIAGEIAWGSPGRSVELKKGGVCTIEIESLEGVPKGTLISLLTPSILRKALD
jgi:phosphohistidine phosphatase